MTPDPVTSMQTFFASAPWAQAPQNLDRLLQANAKAAEVWMASWTRIAQESATFMTKRWAQDTALVDKLIACQTPADVMKVQSDFMKTAFADYMQEAETVARMETEAGAAGLDAYEEVAKDLAVQPMPAPANAKRGAKA